MSALVYTAVLLAIGAPPAGREAASAERKDNVEQISDELLRRVLQDNLAVALVRVVATEVAAPGTRSEAAVADLAVERVVFGDLAPTVAAWRYGAKETTLVQTHRYVVVVKRGMDYTPLLGFVEVPPGAEDEAVRVHREALERLRKTRP